MRVLMVSDVYFPRVNGVSTAIQTYRESLAACGVEISLVAPDYGDGCRESWIRRVVSRKMPFDPEDRLVRWDPMKAAVDAAVAQGCDLIHIQTPFLAHYAGHKAARRAGIPVIATYHTLFEEYLQYYAPFIPASWLRSMARRFSRSQCNEMNAVIVPSNAIHQRLMDYGVSSPMHILPTGVPVEQFDGIGREAFRAKYGIDQKRPVALYVGRVAHEKNIDFLLDMVDLARVTMPEILLVITGEGPALESLRKVAANRGLSHNVQFLGYLDRRTELPDCYAAADVFVFASRTETQGLVLLEAMAAGLPVVALGVMGTLDIVGVRRGAVVPKDDAADFAGEVIDLLRNPDLRARLAREGREYANEWSDRGLATRMATLYRNVAQQAQEASA